YDVAGLRREDMGEVVGGLGGDHRLGVEPELGETTVWDIIGELQKPGFDPRSELPAIPFQDGITNISMLHPGSVVSGVVRSIVDFGAFVDIGLKNDGLIHISQMSDHRIGHPLEVLSVNQYLPSITVLAVDVERQKIDLSLREPAT
ncbi:MAG: S1 RNA-binding domain-containing protein, partial [Spirochaetales bacterium]|nr:S1 RNA-binding domain-containing protein [Spirochaetales bacterium]